ncbi:MAG: hypothetical protein LKI53_01145 [Bacteroidales bacterium]|jgi:hypothetical protein|nr:hypothetical protein [Bacteroidales bacterium]
MEDNKVLNEKESLEIITRMIRNTQHKLERNAGKPFLVWGYATVFATAAVAVAIGITNNPYWNYLWFLIPVIGIPFTLLGKKHQKGIRTYVDQVIGYIWIVFGIVGFIISCISIIPVMWRWKIPVLFMILLLMGMGTTLTGLVTKFRPSIVGGILSIILAFGIYFVSGWLLTLLLFALTFVVMMIIPGHILNYRAGRSNV